MKFIEGSPRQEQGSGRLPVGVSGQQHAFLSDARTSGAFDSLDPRKKTLIDTYYYTDVSTNDLREIAGVKSRQVVYNHIKSSLERLWTDIPENIRVKYVKEEVVKLKDRASVAVLTSSKPRSPETRRKISEAKRGKHHSTEAKKKMSEAKRGKHHSTETRAKISEAKKGKPSPMRGRNHSPETRRKISEAHKGKRHSPETRTKMSTSHLVRQQTLRQQMEKDLRGTNPSTEHVIFEANVHA